MELNEKQKQVVSELKNNIILLASAGTGKTDAMSRRIANIIANILFMLSPIRYKFILHSQPS